MLNQPRTFNCPSCNEVINDSMDVCRFCSAPIDKEAALAAGEIQSRVNQAVSDASYLRTAALTMIAFMGLSFIPFVPLVGWGFLITFFVVLVLLVRWYVKYLSIDTKDPDYVKARRAAVLALVLWLVALIIGFIVRVVLAAVLTR